MSYHVISEKNNAFVWLPIKTASSLVSWVLGHFEFDLFFYSQTTNNYKKIISDLSHFGHSTNLPYNHQDMLFICTMRHPYERVLSYYKSTLPHIYNDFTIEGFNHFLNQSVFCEKSLFDDIHKFNERIPDILIKTETIYDDLLKIPFIKNSKLYECGILEEMCKKKINPSFESERDEYLLSPDIKEKIYNFFKPQFEIFGYSK
jgi:hypothetical protein